MNHAERLAGGPKRGSDHASEPLRAALTLLAAIVFTVAMPARARAGNITVNTLIDEAISGDGRCSLREAINNANNATDTTGGDCAPGTSGEDTIKFGVKGTITLTDTLPGIVSTLTIDGGGRVSIDGASSVQGVVVDSGATAKLDNLTISGNAGLFGSGGGIFNIGTLTVTNTSVFGSAPGGQGGGIFNSGTLTVTNSTIVGGTFGGVAGGTGGGIFNTGTLTFTNSAVSGEAPGSCGGGIFNSGALAVMSSTVSNSHTQIGARSGFGAGICNDGTLTITNSTVSGNFSGGILSFGTLTVINSTIAGNSGPPFFLFAGLVVGGPTTIINSTIWGNGSGGVADSGSTEAVTISNSILADNSAGNCILLTPPIEGGNNISDDNSCGFGSATAANGATIGDNVDPLLDPNGLQSNGGPTETIALQSTSPAIDAIPAASCPATDQRGVPRPDNFEAACDIGSYEFFDFAGTPGQRGCTAQSVAALSEQFGSLATAASALGFPNAHTLKAAIRAFCRG